MYIRPKTKRRLLILGGVALFVGIAVGAMAHSRGKNLTRQAAASRATGLERYHAADYAAAAKALGVYIEKSGTAVPGNASPDLEALFAYGRSRQLVPFSPNNNQHLVEASRIYETYLTFKPDDPAVLHTLLGVYHGIGYQKEAMRVADDLLALRADDVEAMWVKAQLHLRLPKPALADAIKVLDRMSEVAPADLRAHREAQKVRLQMGAAPEMLIARADDLRKRNDGDPRFELLLGITYLMLEGAPGITPDPAKRAEWRQRGETWLQTAANRNAPDAEFVRFMTVTLDGQRFFPQSLGVLINAVDKAKIDDRDVARRLIQRLWEAGALRAVVDRTEAIDPAAATSDPRVLGYRALTLYQMDLIERGPTAQPASQPATRPADAGRRARADAIVAALAARANDAVASAWATVLRGRFPAGGAAPLPPRDQLKQFETAQRLSPDLAIAYFMVGETYDILGEAESAKRAYGRRSAAPPPGRCPTRSWPGR
jgi:tetratricopeptide (TPR) repeat protein